MSDRITTKKLPRYNGGMNNVLDPHNLEDSRDIKFLRDALNVDFDPNGGIKRRRGYALMHAGAAHSLWSDDGIDFGLCVQGGELKAIDQVGDTLALTTLRAVSGPCSYAWLNDSVYWSDGVDAGVIQRVAAQDYTLSEWGVEDPAGPPMLAPVSNDGGMAAGRYLVAVSFMSTSGEEGAASDIAMVQVPAGGGIDLQLIPRPVSAAVAAVRIWCTEANSETLKWAADVPVGATSAFVAPQRLGRELDTLHHARVPPASIVRAYRGRLYLAAGNVVYYTPALRYGLIRPDQTAYRFPSAVRMLEPCDDGLYVGLADRVYFISGADPTTAQQVAVDRVGVIPGASCRVRASVGEGQLGPAGTVLWWNRAGVLCRGGNSGNVTHMTERRLALPDYESGSMAVREERGARRVVAALKNPGPSNALAVGDSASATVYRNGIELP